MLPSLPIQSPPQRLKLEHKFYPKVKPTRQPSSHPTLDKWLQTSNVDRESLELNLRPLLERHEVEKKCAPNLELKIYRQGQIQEPIFEQIVCFSDVHGDFDLLLELLLNVAQVIEIVIPFDIKWIGGKTAIVIVGDFVDRNRPKDKTSGGTPFHWNKHLNLNVGSGEFLNEEESILDFVNLVHVLALAQGGAVFKIAGNHDLQYLWNASRYATPMELFRYNQDRKKAFASGESLNRRYQLCGVYGILQIYNLFFVHGGFVTPNQKPVTNFDNLSRFFKYLNQQTRQVFKNPEQIQDDLKRKDQAIKLYNLFVNPKTSPFWIRDYHQDGKKACHLWEFMLHHQKSDGKRKSCSFFSASSHFCPPPVLITGHTPTTKAFEKLEDYSNMNYLVTKVSEDKSRIVYGGPTCQNTFHKKGETSFSPHTIRYFCCPDLKVPSMPSIWMVDSGGSRAMDKKESIEQYKTYQMTKNVKDLGNLAFRRPQLLLFQFDKEKKLYLPFVVVSKRLLPRY